MPDAAERRAATREDARLRAWRSRFAASDLFRSQQNERKAEWLKDVSEKQQISIKQYSVLINHAIRIASHYGTAKLLIIV